MCLTCGCLRPGDDHSDARSIVLADLEDAAAAAGITAQQAAQNITDTLAATHKGAPSMIRTAPATALIRKRAPSVVLKVDADEPGVVEALVSTTAAVDSQNDVIEPGAYAKFIAAVKEGRADPPAVCKEHEWSTITGTTLDLEEWLPGDDRLPEEHKQNGWGALWVRYRYILDSSDGANAYAVKKARPFGQHSVGFLIDEFSESEGKPFEWKGAVRHIKRIYPLAEHSDVLMGAAPRTQGLRVKSEGAEVDDPEQRQARSSRRLARAHELVAEFKTTWSTAYQNDLPDSAFAYIEDGGKDAEGKTTPRSLRHFPHHDKNGDPDEAHVTNALGRIPQSDVPDSAKDAALAHIKAHAGKLGIEVSEDGKSLRTAGGEWRPVVKATTHSHYHFHPDGEAHSHKHTHAGDVTDHDGPATKVPHAHGHDDDGKAAVSAELKADLDIPGLPALSDDEAMHYGPLLQALDGIKALIAQECAEPGYGEFGDIVSLACVGQDLIRWARGEASEYGGGMYSAWDLFAAGREALEAKRAAAATLETPATETPTPDPLAVAMSGMDMAALIPHAATEAVRPSPQHNVPDPSDGSDDLMHFARHGWHR